MIAGKVNASGVRRALTNAFGPQVFEDVVQEVEFKVFRNLVESTPKRWTGQTRRGWTISRRTKPGYRRIFNRSRVMGYLERGTPERSPGSFIYPTRKKALFVPLTRKAAFFARSEAQWGQLLGEDDFVGDKGGYVTRTTKKGKLKTDSILYGVDYVLAKRVRGIKPMWIARTQQQFANEMLAESLQRHVRGVINKALGK